MVMATLIAACAVRHSDSGASGTAANQAASNGASPLIATVQIDYSHRDDFLRSVTVTKFTAVSMIPIVPGEERPGTSIFRFEGGGVPIWQIHADEGVARELLTEIPLVAAGSKYAVSKLRYGELPKNFLESIPEAGPPEPLEAGSYYVFEVDRASGSTSFDAIRIDPDGTIESYQAQPRAGESYALCCEVNSDFAGADQP
jgi:hypothetical protein